ncbi:uncharacterized protein BX663DRAFT_496742 [Cokeromyces recurvatus]|uniref:uncharacterized protein n=1 Tax=Cokeromyces recurvatus TaxID=90255 RepID=UPI00221F50C9|nr:uncharacterized protein BX663DRAFT_496742 [Cokeromyces recurvatus]KAI7906519.1 hypothetical protein BX663DRAFT_496742 [Cokeromyces recurvatus]
MSENNEASSQKHEQQHNNLRNVLIEKQLKKNYALSGWEKVRNNINEINENSVFITSPVSSLNSSPASSRSNTPKLHHQTHNKKNLNPFSRSSTLDNFILNSSENRPTMANTTLAAAQAAGMTNFTHNFRPARHYNGAIYATSTAVQQDIYRLERDLDKILIQSLTRSQYASFAESASLLTTSTTSTTITENNNTIISPTTFAKKAMFQKQSIADLFHSTAPFGSSNNDIDTNTPINEDSKRINVTRISTIMSTIMDTLKKHKAATRLPLAREILALLAAPFDRCPLLTIDCEQALDIFEYIQRKFVQIDATEQFERLMFCCRLLASGDLTLKKRVLNIINNMLIPCKHNTTFLPSTPQSYHSLVYTLTNALTQLNIQKKTMNHEIEETVTNDLDMDENHIRSGIIDILDRLANGRLIPLIGDAWSTYYKIDTISTTPVSVAKFCVVEGLCKCLMVGICSQNDPYQGLHEPTVARLFERARDILILQDLLERYWIEPELEVYPAYFKIIFLFTELACETFLAANIEDLKIQTSTVSLLLPVIVDKLSPAKLQNYLTEKEKDKTQNRITSNVIVMLLALLSICSLENRPLRPSSPQPVYSLDNLSSLSLSPRLSVSDFTYDNTNQSPLNDGPSSINMNFDHDATIQSILLKLKGYIEEFWKSGYKEFIISGIESMHQDATGERVACTYQNLVFHIDPTIGEEIVKRTLSSLFARLVDTFPPALPAICHMLHELSKRYKTLFYKHVVSCVATDDEMKVSEYMKLITCLRRYLSGVQFWMQDAEMINVLLLSNIGKSKRKQHQNESVLSSQQCQANNGVSEIQWGTTTLGQCTIATEFMWAIKELRAKQKDPYRNMEEDEIAKKFLIDLERRLAVFLAAKEKTALMPMPMRVIFVIEWAVQPIASPCVHTFQCDSPSICPNESPPIYHPSSNNRLPVLHTNDFTDIVVMFERIQNVYLNVIQLVEFETNHTNDSCRESLWKPNITLQDNIIDTQSVKVPHHKRHQVIQAMYPTSNAAIMALDLNPPKSNHDDATTDEGPALKLAKYRFENMEKINQDAFGSVFSLLAAVFTTLSSQEFGRLVQPLWEQFMDDRKPKSFIPAVFLLMECGEKIPKTMIEVCTYDFYSGDPLRRLSVIQKHASMFAFRFNVLSQEYIPISSRRRPFRGDGGAFSTPFVPTDLGSNQFTLDEPRWMAKLKNASNFPIELKRQIQELGWDDEDNGEEHEALKKVLTPLALLPSLFLEEEEERMNEDDTINPAVSINGKKINISKIITRRKRATTIHALTIAFLSMVDLLTDDYGGASNALRELLEYFLRDAPALFLRAFLNDLGKFNLERHKDMLTRVRLMTSMQHKLPPGFTHILFNYLAGMCKWLVRENKKREGLALMTLMHPILAELTLSTNDLSIRDLRKNKIEHLLISTGRFWFTHEQPAELFPRNVSSEKTPFIVLDIPEDIFSVAMLRISHIQFLTNYLIRYPREVYAVKKTLQDYESTPNPGKKAKVTTKWIAEESCYPNLARRRRYGRNTYIYDGEGDMIKDSFMPECMAEEDEILKTASRQPTQQHLDIDLLSSLRARIWLRFVDCLLNGLNKNYNDRDELERILQGINLIIIEHTRDFGIIGQALILYTRVVTRFKRLFISNRGYTAFLPALFKVFCEVECFPQVRSAIIFAWCRFYAVHEESFVFQMLGTLVPLILNAYTKSSELGSWMIDNLFILMQAMHNPPRLGATSDVLGLQLQVELDDHERSIQERIDAVSDPMTMSLSTAIFKPLARSVTTPISSLDLNNYNNKSFELQDFIKLFLTIIAYDPGSLRAEQFVKIFRHLIPRFHKLSIVKDLMDEGVSALVDVFTKFSKHAKVAANTGQPINGGGYQGVSTGIDHDTRIPGNNNSRTESAQHAYGKQWQQNDKLTVRIEFISLVHEYLKNGGTLSEVSHEKMAMIIRSVMRDYGNMKGYIFKTDWIKGYLIDCLHSMADIRNYTKSFKKLLNQIFSQYRSQWKTIEASDLYDGLAVVLEQGQGKPMNMHDIASVMNEKFVIFGLNIATRTNWDGDMKGYNKFCNSLARLIIAIMENSTQDVLGNIEQLTATPELIAHILIPICLQYNLQWNYSSNISMSGRFRPDPTSNWTRLLNYISRACSQASLLKSKNSGFSLSNLTSTMGQTMPQDAIDANEFLDIKDSKQTPQSVALLFSLSFVAMKIILVRGHSSFNKVKGAWAQVAFFIKSALVFGQTLKFLKPKSGRSSPNIPATPVTTGLSPGGTGNGNGGVSASMSTWAQHLSPEGRTTFSFTAPLGVSNIYDFTTWRFLEFVVCYRCPLFVMLKDFIQQKLLTMGGNVNNRSSFYTPSPSPHVSMNFGGTIETGGSLNNSPRETNNMSNAPNRWKSWGGSSLSSPRQPSSSFGIIPQLNIQDIDAENNNTTSLPNGSLTSGLGLHIPGKASISSSTNASSLHTAPIPNLSSPYSNIVYESSDAESSVPPTSPYSPSSAKPNKNRTSSTNSVPGQAIFDVGGDEYPASTTLHILHAESITSIIHVQIAMGFKPALPWIAAKSHQIKPWKQKETVAKLANEWQLLLQLYAES